MMHYLDEAILFEILARVPVRSLLRFKCVSRQWRDLISDPVFARAQLRISTQENPNPRQRLVLKLDRGLGMSSNSVSLLDIARVAAAGRGELRFDPGRVNAHVVASCHGLLVCLLADTWGPRLFLYNPATAETRELPAAPSHHKFSSVCVAGLGYDASNDDYKLIVGTHDLLTLCSPPMVDIFSLRSNSWTSMGEFTYRIQEIHGKYSNGFLLWPVEASILSFDVTKEEFHQGLLPMPSFREDSRDTRLGVTGGGWLIAQRRLPPNTTELWIMKGYCGPDSTWTKLCYLSLWPWSCTVICPWIRDGKIILCAALGLKRFGIYDPEDGSRVDVEVAAANSGISSIITSYVESLVSPHV